MKAILHKELTILSPEEQEEVIGLLTARTTDGGNVTKEFIAELERRSAAHASDPSGAITLREWARQRGYES